MAVGETSQAAREEQTAGLDDLYFYALLSEGQDLPDGMEFRISDDMYAETLQLQEVLFVSSFVSCTDGVAKGACVNAEKPCSSSSFVACTICAEEALQPEDMFRGKMLCSHLFCKVCITRHITAKIDENSISVACPEPGCGAPLGPEQCIGLLPEKVFNRWCDALCEATLLGGPSSSTKPQTLSEIANSTPKSPDTTGVCYCPFSDCSALLLVDSDEPVTRAECPFCHRLFCARCKVPWHATPGMEFTCEDSQLPNKGKQLDLMLVDLAQEKKWKRCPNCGFFVEKKDGCLHVICRCNSNFCYGCGGEWTPSHQCTQRIG